MGWAKYYEDNCELVNERQLLKEKVKINTVIQDNYRNATQFMVNKEEDCEVEKEFENKYIMCKDCGKVFLFTVRSQRFFKAQGWGNPKRCKKCSSFRQMRYLMHS